MSNNEFLDYILDKVESVNPRIELLKQGYNAIYFDKDISEQYCLQLQPDGKCYLLKNDTKDNEILRELNADEYAKLDLIKGRDY